MTEKEALLAMREHHVSCDDLVLNSKHIKTLPPRLRLAMTAAHRARKAVALAVFDAFLEGTE